jgi:hypothetical protein
LAAKYVVVASKHDSTTQARSSMAGLLRFFNKTNFCNLFVGSRTTSKTPKKSGSEIVPQSCNDNAV